MNSINNNEKTGRILSIIILGFASLWGAIAWFDWLFLTGRTARAMEGGVLFAPHLILLFLGAGAFSLVALFAFQIRWYWRVAAALVPASYVALRLL